MTTAAPDTVAGRLATERNVWLATVRPDGRPHVTPIWFVFERDHVWIATGRDNVKSRNAVQNSSVSVALEDGNDPVVIEGVAHLHERERPGDVVDAFVRKYGWDITVAHDSDVGTVLLWEVVPDKWLFAAPPG